MGREEAVGRAESRLACGKVGGVGRILWAWGKLLQLLSHLRVQTLLIVLDFSFDFISHRIMALKPTI